MYRPLILLLLFGSILFAQAPKVPPAVYIPRIAAETLPPKLIRVELCTQGLPETNLWPEVQPTTSETWTEEVFGFCRLPQKYIDTGVRADRPNPLLLRASAVVNLPRGKHRLLLRGRGASRLIIDGKLLLTTPFPSQDTSGHGSILPAEKYLNLGPDFRFARPGDREAWIHFESPGRDHVVVLETFVGGHIGKLKRRPELGETIVAFAPEKSDAWVLLSPAERKVPCTDAGWQAWETEVNARLDQVDARNRALLREKTAPYWNQRREAGKRWLAATKEVPVPEPIQGYPVGNVVDRFLAVNLARVTEENRQAKKGSVDFQRQILPLLESRCLSCHSGSRGKGGLNLDDATASLAGGKSDGPAITPANPQKSAILARVRAAAADEVMPPRGDRLSVKEIELLETWIREGASRADSSGVPVITPLADDLAFLRRVTLDTVGLVPTLAEIETFRKDTSPERVSRLIDRLLADPRGADHWMGYWLDVLAENPNILNPTLNNTGPFRWWLHESLLDNKPMDLFVTELVRMRGSERFGGPAGFGIASQNDVPMAAKGTIISSAFLGIEMKCARCHDAPSHVSRQEDLFRLAAMLAAKPLNVPTTSSVPLDRIHEGGRKPLIAVTLKPGSRVEPVWPFADLVPESVADTLAEDPKDSRDRLAALLTAPQNERFAQVLVNRLWRQYFGRGIVEPVDDWEKGRVSHPELLRWLGRELVRSGYDLRQISRLLLQSHAYRRAVNPLLKEPSRVFASAASRRLTAEQIVDSAFAATGTPFRLEEMSLDIDGIRDLNNSISLGKPRRSWMLTSTSNERDRPSLALPRIQAVADVLSAFGWRGARQDPLTVRDTSPNVLQPAILSNGVMGSWLTRLTDDHGVTKLALVTTSPEELVESLFLAILTRQPSPEEKTHYSEHLRAGYNERVRPARPKPSGMRQPEPYVSWSNHLDPQATILKQKQEVAARKGDPLTDRLDPQWRQRLEDVLWAVLNAPEFLFAP